MDKLNSSKPIKTISICTLIDDINSFFIKKNPKITNINLNINELGLFCSHLDQNKYQIFNQVIYYSKSTKKDLRVNLVKQSNIRFMIYGFVYLLIKENKIKLVKYYYRSLLLFYHNNYMSIDTLTAITSLIFTIDKHYDYNFYLVNVVIKSITNNRYADLPSELFEIFDSSFNDQSFEYHLNKEFLLLLSIGNPDISKILLRFLIRIFKYHYDFKITSFLVKSLVRANFWLKYNSITLIRQLITEEEKFRKTETPSFFIKKGFVIQNANPIILQPFNALENEYTIILSFRFESSSNETPNDKSVILEIREIDNDKKTNLNNKKCFEIFIQNRKLYFSTNKSGSNLNTNFLIEPNKDYRIIVTQKKHLISHLYLYINNQEFNFKYSLPEFLKKELSFIFGQNFNGVIGTFILFCKTFHTKEDINFFKHVCNLYEDYELMFKLDNDLSLIKDYNNHIVSQNKNFYEAFKYFKTNKLKSDLLLSPDSCNRFLNNKSSFRIHGKIKVKLEKANTSFEVKLFKQYTIFQFLKFEGLKYISLLFGLLSRESNDDMNMFIDNVFSILFHLIDCLGEKYFNNSLNVLFTIIFNYIATNETFKLNHSLFKSLFDKINCFNINDEINLRNCLVKLLINKNIYLNEMSDANAISLFSSVISCIQSNPEGLIKKRIVNQLLNYTYIMEQNDSSQKYYMKLLKVLVTVSVRKNKIKKCEPLITYLVTHSDMNEVLHYKLIKIIYLNFGKDDIVVNNKELACYLVNQLESGTPLYHCKWCSLSKSLSYLLVIDYIKKKSEFRTKFILQIDRLCTHYILMQSPSIEFLKCVFIQLFKETPPLTKVAFIKGKASFKDIIFTYTKGKKEDLESKLKSFEKYIEIILERPSIDTDYAKYSAGKIINIFKSLIQDMIETNKNTENKELKQTIEIIFSSQAMTDYMLFLFRKEIDKPEIMLIDIIEKTIELIENPFYFNFLFEYYDFYVDREHDQRINDVLNSIIKKLNSNVNNRNSTVNRNMFLIALYKIIKLGQSKVSDSLETCAIIFITTFTSKKNDMIDSKQRYLIDHKKKNCLEVIIDILLMLYEYRNYSMKYEEMIKEILRPKHTEPTTLYFIDKNHIENKKKSNDKNNYSFCIYFLVKFLKYLHKERDNKQFFHFLKEIAILTANDALHLHKQFKSKSIFKSDVDMDSTYNDIKAYIEWKYSDKNFELLEKYYIQNSESKKLIGNTNKKTNSYHLKKSTSFETTVHSDPLGFMDSNVLKDQKDFNIKLPSDLDIINGCDSIHIKKRSMSQQNSQIKINILRKSTTSKNNNFVLNNNNQRHLFFIDIKDKESIKFMFHLKHNLIWNTFPFVLKDCIFKNKTFISMKRCYNELYFKENKTVNALKELDYPTKIKNYTTKYYYKPFIKPDIDFYLNHLYPISHPYYTNAVDNTMTQFSFSKILPKIKKIIFQANCELLTHKGAIYGEIILSSNFVLFVACCDKDIRFNKNIPVEEKMKYVFSSDENDNIKISNKKLLFYIDDIEEIISRRCYFQWTGLEFFLSNRQTYCLNFFNENPKLKFLSELVNLNNSSKSLISIITNVQNHFKKNEYTKLWIENKMSTFNYLLLVNKYASRTYNDIYQYLIFPWVTYDISGSIRDMSNVICDQAVKNRENAVSIYQQSDNHYNFHYSNGGHVLYYLVRLNPFTYTHIKFQSYKFDSAPRLFNSIKDTLTIFSMLKETRELIPEFFYDTNFLINLNKNDMGIIKNRNNRINDVLCNDNTINIQFIIMQRLLLEKNEDVCQWINNVFGINQSKVGSKALHFSKNTYEKNNNFKNKMTKWKNKGLSNQIIYDKIRCKVSIFAFGMTPCQLFSKSHPKRNNTQSNANIKQEFNYNNMKQYLSNIPWKADNFRVGVSNNKIFFKYCSHLDIFEINLKERKDYALEKIKFEKQGHLRFRIDSFCQLSSEIFAFCRFFDNTIKIISVDNKINLVIQCYCFITSICSIGNNLFVTGDEHGFICKWKLRNIDVHSDFSFYNDIKVIGHESEVLKIIYEARLDIIISIDELNICVIHNATTLDLLNIIEVNSKIKEVKVSFQDFLFFLCDSDNSTKTFYCYTLNGLLVSKSTPTKHIVTFELSNNSAEIIIAQGSHVYKTNFLTFEYEKNKNNSSFLYSEEEKVIKEMIYLWELKLFLFVFFDNSITLKMLEI